MPPSLTTASRFSDRSWILLPTLLSVVILALPTVSQAAAEAPAAKTTSSIPWIRSPSEGLIADKAKIKLNNDLLFLNSDGTKQFLKATGNLPAESSFTLASQSLHWFAIFRFVGDGYIKDDEKIDADAILTVLKENNVKGIEERKKQGLEPLYLDGWFIPPHYDSDTKRLEWATNLHDEKNQPIINFTARLLGRGGYMNTTLVSDPENLSRDIKSFKAALTSYDFVPGERYSEYTAGDKVAAYGLGALVLGGAAAAVASKGGFKAIGLLIIGAFAAVVAFVKKLVPKK